MKYLIVTALVALGLVAAPAYAADAPAKYRKCKGCHGTIGSGKGKMGPDLATSALTLEQWAAMVEYGSKAPGRAPAQEKYAKKKMPAQKGVTPEQVKEMYDYAQSMKK